MGWEDPDPAEVVQLLVDADWDELLDRYEPNLLPRPFERCLEVVKAGGAQSVIIETRYIDVDY